MKLLILLLLVANTVCQSKSIPAEATQPVGVPTPQAGQTVLFLGDSITWQDLYTSYIEQYFSARYPERKIRFINRGVRGDTAAEAIARLRRDLVPDRPDLVLVLLGMNDGGYKGYNRGLLRFYLENLQRLVQLIFEKTGAKVVLVTSTPVDPVDYNMKRYNQMLKAMAEGAIDLGKEMRVPVIDLFSFFHGKLEESGRQSPPIELMLDPIHPGPAGHLVMAHLLLTHLDPHPDAAPDLVVDLKEGQSRFSLTVKSRPVFLSPAARPATRLVPFQETFNRQRLILKGAPATARLKAGGVDLGAFTREELASGVDIFGIEDSPWTREAQERAQRLQDRWIWFYCLWDPKEAGADVYQQISPLGKAAPQITRELAKKSYREALRRLEELDSSRPGAYTIEITDEGRTPR